jgi:enoyl-CoA hydratase
MAGSHLSPYVGSKQTPKQHLELKMSIELSIRDNLALMRLNRPETLNALSFSILREINDAISQIEIGIENKTVRGLVVTGSGEKAFCAGADITELVGRTVLQEHEGARLGQSVFSRLAALRVPSVAVIHGYAFGGGLELALACAFRVATSKAKLGLPEVKLGLIPGYGGTQRLPRLVGEGRALEIIMSGRNVDAIEAERIGLVNKLVEEGDPVALGVQFLGPMLKNGLVALDLARQAVARGMQTTLQEGLKIECDLSTLAYQTKDAKEGMQAFMQKRPSQFKDE